MYINVSLFNNSFKISSNNFQGFQQFSDLNLLKLIEGNLWGPRGLASCLVTWFESHDPVVPAGDSFGPWHQPSPHQNIEMWKFDQRTTALVRQQSLPNHESRNPTKLYCKWWDSASPSNTDTAVSHPVGIVSKEATEPFEPGETHDIPTEEESGREVESTCVHVYVYVTSS